MKRFLVILAVLGLLFAACGDDGNTTTDAGAGDNAADDASSAGDDPYADDPAAGANGDEAADPAAAADGIVMKNIAFTGIDTAKKGEPITVTNDDPFDHTLTADDGSFDTEVVVGGASEPLTIDEVGTFSYHCEIHGKSAMSGEITIEA